MRVQPDLLARKPISKGGENVPHKRGHFPFILLFLKVYDLISFGKLFISFLQKTNTCNEDELYWDNFLLNFSSCIENFVDYTAQYVHAYESLYRVTKNLLCGMYTTRS